MFAPNSHYASQGKLVPLPHPPSHPPQAYAGSNLHSRSHSAFVGSGGAHTASQASLVSLSAAGPPPPVMYAPAPHHHHHQAQPYSQHPNGASSPPFQFLRLKSFSTTTNSVLRKLEKEILMNPNNPQAYLDLGEEYRVLGARHSYIRVLEYGKAHFPQEATFRTLLYQHLPNRPRTPPPAEPAIQMERNNTYDYKWRHKEPNLFPKQIYKLDTNVPPYGRQLRAHYLHFLSLVRAEDAYVSKARMKELHEEALRAMGDQDAQSGDVKRDNEIAITIPANFNRIKGQGPQATISQPDVQQLPQQSVPPPSSQHQPIQPPQEPQTRKVVTAAPAQQTHQRTASSTSTSSTSHSRSSSTTTTTTTTTTVVTNITVPAQTTVSLDQHPHHPPAHHHTPPSQSPPSQSPILSSSSPSVSGSPTTVKRRTLAPSAEQRRSESNFQGLAAALNAHAHPAKDPAPPAVKKVELTQEQREEELERKWKEEEERDAEEERQRQEADRIALGDS